MGSIKNNCNDGSCNTMNGIVIMIVLCISLSIYVFSLDTDDTDTTLQYKQQNKVLVANTVEGFMNNRGYQDVVVKERKDKLLNQINKYAQLDLPINIDDNGHLCQDWNSDPQNRYTNSGNSCQLVGNDAICMNKSAKTSQCNKIYNRNIKELGIIDIHQLINKNFNHLKPLFKEVDELISKKELVLQTLVQQLIQLKNTKNQQNYFVTMNKNYLGDSNIRKKNVSDIYDTENNKYSVNSNNFSINKEEINKLIHKNENYDKILFIVGAILLLLLLIYLFSQRV